MSFAEFWVLTPADVVIAIDAHQRRERAAYWRAGLITSAIVNANRKRGAKAAKPEDFVPRPKRQQAQSPEQMANALKALTLAMGGKVVVRGT